MNIYSMICDNLGTYGKPLIKIGGNYISPTAIHESICREIPFLILNTRTFSNLNTKINLQQAIRNVNDYCKKLIDRPHNLIDVNDDANKEQEIDYNNVNLIHIWSSIFA